MHLKIDRASAQQFVACVELPARPDNDQHTYCAEEPYRAIIICHANLVLDDLAGAVVDAAIGEVQGEAGVAREANVGLSHTQIVIYGRLPGFLPEKLLAQVLVDGKRDHERRPRPKGSGQE